MCFGFCVETIAMGIRLLSSLESGVRKEGMNVGRYGGSDHGKGGGSCRRMKGEVEASLGFSTHDVSLMCC